MSEQNKLLAQLDRYWECLRCGRVIDDPATAKDLGKAGLGWGEMISCPKCGERGSKERFPDARFRPLFEMLVECFQLKREILVLILAQTTFEAMLRDLMAGLLYRRECHDDITFAITNTLRDTSTTERFIKELTGETVHGLFKEVGFKDNSSNFQTNPQ